MELVETPSMKTHQDDQMVQSLKQPLMCPRCESANTKFCYYNNYTKSQPRHYCRSCKRYWTEGGTLRNVPLPTGGRAAKKRRIRTPSKSKNNKMGPTGGSNTSVSFDEGLDQKMDTQLVVLQKDASFGGISSGRVQNDVLEILHNNPGCTHVVGCCSSDQSLFDHEVFSFQLPEVSELVQRNVDMDLRWEDDDHTFCVTDFLNMDVPEVIQPWS